MKRILILLIAGITIVISTERAQAQAALFILIFGDKVASENFHLSLDIGLNAAKMSGFDDGKSLIGLNFGLGTHIKINDRWYLAPEFKPLSPKGARDVANPIDLDEQFEVDETNSKIKLNYIEVPLLVQYRLPAGWYFSAGPQLSFLTSAKQETEIILTSGTLVDVEQDLKDNFKSFDWSIPVEVGYAFKEKRGGKGIDLRLRYTYGFNDVFESGTDLSANHSTFQFILTFPFVEVAEE
ncbi:MAG: PorT family protein [Cyclobacteriaceae bacterium]|nr:PorT family protein [Cyclobacteriaceae bacterium]